MKWVIFNNNKWRVLKERGDMFQIATLDYSVICWAKKEHCLETA